MVIVSLGAMVEVICIGENGAPAVPVAAMMGVIVAVRTCLSTARETCAAGASSWALPWRGVAPSPGWVDGPSRSARWIPWSRCAFVAFDCTGQSLAACTLVACIRFHVVLQLAGRLQMVRLVDATIQSIDPPLRGALLDISGGGYSVACSCNGHKPITSNHSRGLHLLSSKIALVQSVHMAHGWPQRTAQCPQLQRCSPLSHRARDSTASLLQRGHVMPWASAIVA